MTERDEDGDESRAGSPPSRTGELQPVRPSTARERWLDGILFALLGLICAALLVPKLILVWHANTAQFGQYGLGDLAPLAIQDAVLATFLLGGLLLLLRRAGIVRLLLAIGCTTVVLVFLLLDCRTRQVWLKPIDWGLVQYTLTNLENLAGGQGAFFNYGMGFGMSARRLMVLVTAGFLGLWCAYSVLGALRWRLYGSVGPSSSSRLLTGIAWSLCAVAVVSAIGVGNYRYQLEVNALVGPLLDPLRATAVSDEEERALAAEFELRPRPLDEVLAVGPRERLQGVEPFRNLVVVIMESVRWRGLDLGAGGEIQVPTMRRLAGEGLAAECLVPLPHSSKAYFAVLTGLMPYPGIEMRESVIPRFESIFWSLREKHGYETWCLSSLFLQFENTHGLLSAAGVERRVEALEVAREMGAGDGLNDSFGGGDEVLAQHAARMTEDGGRPFASVLLPLAAHYPYHHPGKADPEDVSWASYSRSVSYSDDILGRILEGFALRTDFEETLFVIVGDHGESFGEHGSYIHNNSLYQEEVTVPLIFWAPGQRLQTSGFVTAKQTDVAPTVADLMGLSDGSIHVQGRSLLRADPDRLAFMTTFFDGVAAAMVEDGIKSIYRPTSGELQVYDLRSDPGETRPIELPAGPRAETIRRIEAMLAFQRRAFPLP